MTDIVIVNGARTAMGGFQGALSSATAPELGAITMKSHVQVYNQLM
jgi:acetyl-CoA C-acetyltransferase